MDFFFFFNYNQEHMLLLNLHYVPVFITEGNSILTFHLHLESVKLNSTNYNLNWLLCKKKITVRKKTVIRISELQLAKTWTYLHSIHCKQAVILHFSLIKCSSAKYALQWPFSQLYHPFRIKCYTFFFKTLSFGLHVQQNHNIIHITRKGHGCIFIVKFSSFSFSIISHKNIKFQKTIQQQFFFNLQLSCWIFVEKKRSELTSPDGNLENCFSCFSFISCKRFFPARTLIPDIFAMPDGNLETPLFCSVPLADGSAAGVFIKKKIAN